MRIEYLLLENFALVKSGMGLTKLELDFKKYKNVITLIVGNNGTGKTGGVLSNLHPFAGLGHLEARDDVDIIIPGTDGHKVIVFKTKKHEYYIEHFYQSQGANRSRKISSYCKKDGKELNPTGSVTQFNLLIKAEFKIDMNFLKLMRLGPNVKNFIGLGATERKSFIANLLAEVEYYMRDHKAATEETNLLKNALKIALDKKAKLGIEDVTVLKDTIEEKQKKLAFLRKSKEDAIKEFFAYKGSIDTSRFATLGDDILRLGVEMMKLRKEQESLKEPKYLHVDLSGDMYQYRMDQMKHLNDEKVEIAKHIAAVNLTVANLKEEFDKLNAEIDSSRETLEGTELSSFILDLESRISSIEKSFDTSKRIDMTKAELLADTDKINMIAANLDVILSMEHYVLKYYFDTYPKYMNDLDKMHKFIRKHMDSVSVELQQYEVKKQVDKQLRILYTPSGCTEYDVCPYYKTLEVKQDSNKNKERKAELKLELECLDGLTEIATALQNIKRILAMRNSDVITEYVVDEARVMEAILHQDKKLFIDPKVLQNLMERIELQNEYDSNKKQLEEAKMKLELMEAKASKKDYQVLLAEQGKIAIKLDKEKTRLNKLTQELMSVNQKINAAEELLRDYSDAVTYSIKSGELANLIEAKKKEIAEVNRIQDESEAYGEKLAAHNRAIAVYDQSIQDEENEIYTLKSKEATFIELQDEIKHTEEFFDYATLIRDAVSSKTGIPKVYIRFYCKALKEIANKIIRDIYDGELILRDFEITDTKFNIPYYTKGTNVSDIRYASQAEASVATIAISFAILMQFMPKYNVILLDEIDGPLHQTNKEKLFASLEGELKDFGCEQVFMITQSKMYNDYPVNLIITDPDYANTVTDKSKVVFQR